MKIVEHTLQFPDFKEYLPEPGESALYFDIETTGLSAHRSHIYLLGVMWRKEETLYLRQWLAQRPSDEEEILRDFLSLAVDFSQLIQFNGTTFDVPYICHKAEFYQLDASVLPREQQDLYLQYRPLKQLLQAPNMKLPTLEALCGYERKDHHSGKELIKVYENYLATGDDELQHLLEQHNYDDILGLLWLQRLNSLLLLEKEQLLPLSVTVEKQENEYLLLRCTYGEPLFSLQHTLSLEGIQLSFQENHCLLRLPLLAGEFYYYYKDYKNYYYLPAEDRAIHKSVGIYVDADSRKKATADTCYEKVQGICLPQFQPVLTPALQGKPRQKERYFYAPQESFFQNDSAMKAYAQHIIRYLLLHGE